MSRYAERNVKLIQLRESSPRLHRRPFSRCLCHPGLPSTDAAGSAHYGRIHVDHLVHKTTCKRRAIASQLPNNVSRGQHVASDVHGDACPFSQGISNTCPACFGPIGTPLAYHVAYKSEHPCDAHSARPPRTRTQPRYDPDWRTCQDNRHHTVAVRERHRSGAPRTKPAVSTHADIEANHARHPHTIR